MTLDFDKMARECTADFRDRGAAWDAVERNIAAALREVWNAAMDEAATLVLEIAYKGQHGPVPRELSGMIISKKVPT